MFCWLLFVCVLNAFPVGEYIIFFFWFTMWIWSEGNISSPIRFDFYLSILSDDNADFFLLLFIDVVLQCFIYNLFKNWHDYFLYAFWKLKCNGLSAGKVVSWCKKEYSSAVHFYKAS